MHVIWNYLPTGLLRAQHYIYTIEITRIITKLGGTPLNTRLIILVEEHLYFEHSRLEIKFTLEKLNFYDNKRKDLIFLSDLSDKKSFSLYP